VGGAATSSCAVAAAVSSTERVDEDSGIGEGALLVSSVAGVCVVGEVDGIVVGSECGWTGLSCSVGILTARRSQAHYFAAGVGSGDEDMAVVYSVDD
jgi:hypothetical protein